jgi:hypothetical protein
MDLNKLKDNIISTADKRLRYVKERLERLRGNKAPAHLIRGEEALVSELEKERQKEQEKKGAA